MRHHNVPESLEGWWILHRMFAFDRIGWDSMAEPEQKEIVEEAMQALKPLKESKDSDVSLAQLLGHKADLMLTHYSRDYDGLALAQTILDKTRLAEFLTPATSYVSVLELGMYDATGKIHASLNERGLNTPTSGMPPSMRCSRRKGKIPVTPVACGLRYLKDAMFASIRWTRSAAKTLIGTCCRSKIARDRCSNTEKLPHVSRSCHWSDLRLDWLRYLRMGRRPLCRRSARLQKARL